MDRTEIISNINGFSNAQIAEFNIECNNKIHSVSQTMISNSDKDLAVTTAEALNNLSESDVDVINASLAANNKLSQRPC